MGRTLAPIAALLFGVAFLLAGNGLQTTLLPIRAELEGFSAFALGAMGSAYYCGFALGCLIAPYAILVGGHIRAYTAMVSLASAAALAHPLIVDPLAWGLFRGITGFCIAGIYLVVESWLNDRANNDNRGFIMSAYIFVVFAMQTVGQMLVTFGNPRAFPLFAIASILASLAVIPVALTRSAQPAPITIVRVRFLSLYKTSPVGFVGAIASGMVFAILWTMGTIYATKSGFSTDIAAYFVSAVVAGGTVAQWPVGRLSDRMDRRIVLLGCMIAATAAALILALFSLSAGPLLVVGALFGAALLPIYSVVSAHTFDHVEPDGYVEVAAGIILANSVGAIIGPLLASQAMAVAGAAGLFWTVVVILTSMIGYTVSRLYQSPRSEPSEKTDFEIYANAPAGAVVTPEPLEESDPDVVMPEPYQPLEEEDEE